MSLSIIALRTRENKLETVTLELIGKAKRFYSKEINVILPVGLADYSSLITELEQAGADKIYVLKHAKLENYSTNFYKKVLVEAIEKIKPEILLLGATANGRDLAPQIASTLQTGLTADCTDLAINEEGKLAATRPTFGGSLMATILSRKLPQMATVRPKVFKKPDINKENKSAIEIWDVEIENISEDIKELSFSAKTLENSSIEDADILVAVGKGIKNVENLELARQFAENIGAKVAATRGLVDLGMCKNDIQVGQTGKTVHPKVYIACGISGALQHIEGIKGAQTIIAINNDINAPIFEIADYKIVGDIAEILPKLVENSKRI